MKSYPLGTQLVLATTFLDPTSRQPVNPTTVVLELRDPLGTVTTPGVSNASTGVYKALVTPAIAGIWSVRWAGTGAVTAATEDRFEVKPSAFLN